jgi:hypothetical protein
MDNSDPIQIAGSISDFLSKLVIVDTTDYSHFQKTVAAKYWQKNDVSFDLNETVKSSLRTLDTSTLHFVDATTLLLELKKITNGIQGANS